MGLFDFFKPKKKSGLAGVSDDPLVRKGILAMQLQYVKQEVSNLKAVGREHDANKRATNYLQECLQEWKIEPSNPSHITRLANAAMSLDLSQFGEESLQIVIEANEKSPFMDLTRVYTDLGRIYHQLGSDKEKELWAYQMATQCESPPKCKFPATSADKATAHDFAYNCALVMVKHEHAKHHDQMRRKLVPDLDCDDMMAVVQWIRNK